MMDLVLALTESDITIERFQSLGQHLSKFIRITKGVCIRKEFNSQRTGLENEHGRRFIVLEHQYDMT